ncbi:MAG: hypothetical protein ABSG43_28685 [Solirubrobacteraceae bacterium]
MGRRRGPLDGRGGIAAVVRATGVSEATVRRGIAELRSGQRAPAGRVRRSGAGRKPILELDPELPAALESLIEPVSRRDRELPLRWTSKSVAKLTEALRAGGHAVHGSTVRLLVSALGYRLLANRRSAEGANHPDRDAQFRHVAEVTAAALAAGQPVIAVDAKVKSGPSGGSWVAVALNADTCAVTVEAIRNWWRQAGDDHYRDADTLTIAADAGAPRSARGRSWRLELQQLADELGITIQAVHFPPGTSRWKRVDQRLVSHLSVSSGVASVTAYEVALDVVGARGGERTVTPTAFEDEWNFTIEPRESVTKKRVQA